MNTKYMQIDALNNQIDALKRAKEMMDQNWGYYTNEPGFKMSEHSLIKSLTGTDYICTFSDPFSSGAKPFLSEMYQLMTDEMIKDLERQLSKLQCE